MTYNDYFAVALSGEGGLEGLSVQVISIKTSNAAHAPSQVGWRDI